MPKWFPTKNKLKQYWKNNKSIGRYAKDDATSIFELCKSRLFKTIDTPFDHDTDTPDTSFDKGDEITDNSVLFYKLPVCTCKISSTETNNEIVECKNSKYINKIHIASAISIRDEVITILATKYTCIYKIF